MRVALLERFAEPSRRCDPARVAEPDDTVVTWDLSDSVGGRPPTAEALRTVWAWVAPPLGVRRRWRLARACLAMKGWRRTALARAPGWAAAVRAGEVDRIACFSQFGFPLATELATGTGRPPREQLADSTQYLGEFAFEHLAVIPYAYWLHTQGLLRATTSTRDTHCFYWFSPDHTERDEPRRYVPITEYPAGEMGEAVFDPGGFPRTLDVSRWQPPPYRERYGDDPRFSWPKPPVIVCNKTSAEQYLGSDVAVNSLGIDVLLELVGRLRDRYTVIYDRPTDQDIVPDDSPIREPGDTDSLTHAYPDVVTVQHLHRAHPELSFNELQLRVFATSERFVSVLGGSSYLASWFGGTNIVFARAGWEVDCGAYDGWFRRFSGASVHHVDSAAALMDAVTRAWL